MQTFPPPWIKITFCKECGKNKMAGNRTSINPHVANGQLHEPAGSAGARPYPGSAQHQAMGCIRAESFRSAWPEDDPLDSTGRALALAEDGSTRRFFCPKGMVPNGAVQCGPRHPFLLDSTTNCACLSLVWRGLPANRPLPFLPPSNTRFAPGKAERYFSWRVRSAISPVEQGGEP